MRLRGINNCAIPTHYLCHEIPMKKIMSNLCCESAAQIWFWALNLRIALGGMYLCGANDFLTIFVAPECLSLWSYLLFGYIKKDVRFNVAIIYNIYSLVVLALLKSFFMQIWFFFFFYFSPFFGVIVQEYILFVIIVYRC